MERDVEVQRFKQLLGYAASSGENMGKQLQLQCERLTVAGLTEGEINDLIHDRNNRQVYTPRAAPTETALKVSYTDKDKAKALGARWNANRKIWVAPAGLDLNKVRKWL